MKTVRPCLSVCQFDLSRWVLIWLLIKFGIGSALGVAGFNELKSINISDRDRAIFSEAQKFLAEEFGGEIECLYKVSFRAVNGDVGLLAAVVTGRDDSGEPVLNRRGVFQMARKNRVMGLGQLEMPTSVCEIFDER